MEIGLTFDFRGQNKPMFKFKFKRNSREIQKLQNTNVILCGSIESGHWDWEYNIKCGTLFGFKANFYL